MQKISLYIQDTLMDMFGDESISFTDTIKNIKDVNKIFTEFTKTFSLPASKINNRIFKHFYNYDIIDGYDGRVRIPAEIQVNHLSYRKGYIKLEGVSLKDNKAHTYRVTFFGNTVSLKEKFGEDKLQSLDWLDNFNVNATGDTLLFNSPMIRDYLQFNKNVLLDGVTYSNPVQVPLLTHSQRLFYDSTLGHVHDDQYSGNLHYDGAIAHTHGVKWNELKYALKIPIIIKGIEERYGLTFSTDFFNSSNDSYEELYMWLHRAKGKVTSGGQTTQYTYTVNDWGASGQDGSSMTASGALVIDNDVNMIDPYMSISLTPVDNSIEYSFTVLFGGVAQYTSEVGSGLQSHAFDPAPRGVPVTLILTVFQAMTFTSIKWTVTGDIQGDGPFTDIYNATSVIIPEQFEFSITQQMPEMKVLDFLTSIFKMFNLVAYVEDDIIVVKTLDSFYAGGGSYDITQYLDVTSSEVDAALPFREVIYGYEGTDSYLAAVHSQLEGSEWGQEKFSNNVATVFSGELYNYTIPFEHMKFERLVNLQDGGITNIQWGYCVDDNQESYIGKPILFYMYRQLANYSFVTEVDENNVATAHVQNDYNWIPCNSNRSAGIFSVQPSLNFFPEVDEWQRTNNNNTLFANYHQTYISEVFNKSRRISKFTAYLPLRILLNYNLADRFVVGGRSYKINSITTNLQNGESKLELLNEV